MPVKKETITAAKVMSELAKHEAECNLRYKRIEELLDDQKSNMTKLDQRLWWIVGLVIIAPFLQRLL
tara:strand:- start:220 stop:420 length:201 start_codon:yes stop_codon:yes gene_type:complete